MIVLVSLIVLLKTVLEPEPFHSTQYSHATRDRTLALPYLAQLHIYFSPSPPTYMKALKYITLGAIYSVYTYTVLCL